MSVWSVGILGKNQIGRKRNREGAYMAQDPLRQGECQMCDQVQESVGHILLDGSWRGSNKRPDCLLATHEVGFVSYRTRRLTDELSAVITSVR